MRENLTRLKAESDAYASGAKKLRERIKSCPHSNEQLLAWLADNRERWQELMQTAGPSRRLICRRMIPLSSAMLAEPRVQACQPKTFLNPALVSKLEAAGPGFYSFDEQSSRPSCFLLNV